MKTVFKFSLFFFIVAEMFSCRKPDLPTPNSTPPVFYFTGNIGTSAINLQAGVNNYYMYSNFNQDANGVYTFSGTLSTYNCTSCGNMVQIKINDFKTTPINGNVQIASSLVDSYYVYQIPYGAQTNFPVTFTSHDSGTPQSQFWNFGDGVTLGSNASNMVSHTYGHPGKYLVFHAVNFGSVVDTSSYTISVGIPEAECRAAFTSQASGTNVYFTASASGTAPYYYHWDFGDGDTSNVANPYHTYDTSHQGCYRVCLHVHDSFCGDVEYVCYTPTQNYTGHNSYFTYDVNAYANPFSFSNVTINWTDANGNHYSSDHQGQPASSYFKILSVDDYANNTNGETTKKLHLNFKCEVYDSNNDSLNIENGDAVIAVAYH